MTAERDALAELVACRDAWEADELIVTGRLNAAWAAASAALAAPAQGEPMHHLTRDEQAMLGKALRASARKVTAQGEPQPIGWTDGTAATGHRVIVRLADGVSLPVGTPLYAAPAPPAAHPAEPPAMDDLVRLLHVASDGYSSVKHDGAAKMCHDAADLIERQAREIAAAIAERDNALTAHDLCKAAADRYKAERDALRECVRALCTWDAAIFPTDAERAGHLANIVNAARAKVKP